MEVLLTWSILKPQFLLIFLDAVYNLKLAFIEHEAKDSCGALLLLTCIWVMG